MKQCSNCHIAKDITEFEDRTDAWGQFAWCYSCRIQEGRNRVSRTQEDFMRRTQMFALKGELCRSEDYSIPGVPSPSK